MARCRPPQPMTSCVRVEETYLQSQKTIKWTLPTKVPVLTALIASILYTAHQHSLQACQPIFQILTAILTSIFKMRILNRRRTFIPNSLPTRACPHEIWPSTINSYGAIAWKISLPMLFFDCCVSTCCSLHRSLLESQYSGRKSLALCKYFAHFRATFVTSSGVLLSAGFGNLGEALVAINWSMLGQHRRVLLNGTEQVALLTNPVKPQRCGLASNLSGTQ
jgi:hypothetical protein